MTIFDCFLCLLAFTNCNKLVVLHSIKAADEGKDRLQALRFKSAVDIKSSAQALSD